VKRVQANGVDFAVLEEGTGPLVLLVHGFPDTAHTWDGVRPAIAKAGFRAVSPFLRGYHPTGPAPDGRYDSESLGRDILALIPALGEEQAIVIGHDYGAAAAYAAASLGPERMKKLFTLAIPHPTTVKPNLGFLWRARHFIRFKLPGAVAALSRHDFALVDELVRRWSPSWQVPPGETDAVKTSFRHPGGAAIAIEYYRQVNPKLPDFIRKPITVPTVTFAGETDGVLVDLAPFERSRSRYTNGYEWIKLPGGHWLHREHPDLFLEKLIPRL
jgi:pimeloyl-ACP methyl ester carboxylesterase